MAISTKASIFGSIVGLLLGGLVAAHARADAGYTITSPDIHPGGFVTTDSVKINITGPSTALILRSSVLLNGNTVTSAIQPDGNAGSMTGTVTGLKPGDNVFQLFTVKTSKVSVAQLHVERSTPPTVACSSLSDTTGLPVANTVITSATLVAATSTVPEHCNIVGTINAGRVGYPSSPTAQQKVYTYAINWQARLPTVWSGRFYMPGGGGLDGSVPSTTTNLNLGYATAANDSGHGAANNDPLASGTAAFGTDFQAREDFSHNAIDVTTQTAKALINRYYGTAPTYSYFQGCSQGGRESMMVTQKLPTYFDGVVAGDPGLKIASTTSLKIYEAKLLANLATQMGLLSINGNPLANNAFTNSDLQLISNAVLTACDSLDGLVDGMVNNSQACTTPVVTPVLNALKCSGAKTAACLSGDQIDTIQKIYAGAKDSQGNPLYFGWMWDPGIAGCTSPANCNAPGATNIATGWRSWKMGTFQANPATAINNALDFSGASNGGGLTTVVAHTPPTLPASTASEEIFKIVLNYNLDDYAPSVFATTAAFPVSAHDQLDTDAIATAFANRGGKLLYYIGQSGGPFSPLALISYYSDTNAALGGTPTNFAPAQNVARLFLVPGMQHCSGGPATDTFDSLTPVVNWVENHIPPDSILATALATTPWPGRTRPLCPFPQFAHYKGSGDINVASNFICQ